MNLVNFRIFLKLSCLPSCVNSFLQNGMFQYGEHCYTSQLGPEGQRLLLAGRTRRSLRGLPSSGLSWLSQYTSGSW